MLGRTDMTGLAIVVLLGSGGATAVAVGPPNDAFGDRIELVAPSGQVTASTLGASSETGEPAHAGDLAARSAWWRWKPAADGRLTVSTMGSGFDTRLALYTGQVLTALQLVDSNDDWYDGEVRSLVVVGVKSGKEYQIAVDGFEGAQGFVVLTWCFVPQSQSAPANDAFSERAQLQGESGQIVGSTSGATKEAGEPAHGVDEGGDDVGGASAWWSWTAPSSGVATFQTNSSGIDTILAVYTGSSVSGLELVSRDDDSGEGYSSCVVCDVAGGEEYEIAVDGYDAESGMVVLNWLLSKPCTGPQAAFGPRPADGAQGVALDVELRWNLEEPLRRKVIYGNDDRKEVYEITDPAVLKAWDSTLILIPRQSMTDLGDGTYGLPSTTLAESFPALLCPDEPYRDQPDPGWCSGFLVGPDLVATAGHCVPSLIECSALAFIFGFRMLEPGKPALKIPKTQVYFCSGIVASRFSEDPEQILDWSVVRLDRPVPDHTPLQIRRSGRIADGEQLLVIGHPLGLPAKIAGGARVRENSAPEYFVANLDVYGGNSGSAVFDAATLVVEGVLVAGEEDFEDTGTCIRSKRCPDDGCAGEVSVRTAQFAHLIPPLESSLRYEVYFGECGRLELAGTSQEASWQLAALKAGSTYCWQIVSKDECGSSEGPLWTFSTGGGQPGFVRGDATADGELDITDGIATLNYLFLGGPAPGCLKRADSDDDGKIVLSDAIYVLNYLFLGGPPPASPFPACGPDTTPDGLSCEGDNACP